VLDSALCLLEGGRVYYRGRDAAHLADEATLEDVARLMWGTDSGSPVPATLHLPAGFRAWLRQLPKGTTAIERAKTILVHLATDDIAAVDTANRIAHRVGHNLVRAIAAAVAGKMPDKSPIHQQLAAAWQVNTIGTDLVRRCLVLSADHELNVSTYVARCVASTGATPYAVVLGALSALSGPRHGGMVNRAEVMLREFVASGDPAARIKEKIKLGERLPGFGHPLYPQGDPRASAILDALRRSLPRRQTATFFAIAAQVHELSGRAPVLDYALAATSILLRLPPGSAQGLFLVGRSVGWIAHAIEQYAAGVLIRPRARYVGVLPEL
jgi:citrate synthase